jgi:hypothetical protein
VASDVLSFLHFYFLLFLFLFLLDFWLLVARLSPDGSTEEGVYFTDEDGKGSTSI